MTRAPEIYARWLKLWNGDDSEIRTLIAPDFEGSWPGRPKMVRGQAALLEVIRQSHAFFTELHFRLEVGPVAQENLLAARWTSRGRYAGGMPGATAPAGLEVTFGGMDLLRLEGGRIREYWVNSDALELMTQLGVVRPG
ncbi:putative ester cyclase [Deinobacterium chartae]|uniref:Putative ester cyclase n=1 Tax=Deinobacterium chartae TaxID=521158 RepID=A0A841HZV3_9DEIO|nr:ester cyclase [Deinobacterium chartae]MBB6097729.1 putative ester cyclase [Deinobacterium chartae]